MRDKSKEFRELCTFQNFIITSAFAVALIVLLWSLFKTMVVLLITLPIAAIVFCIILMSHFFGKRN